MITFTGQLADPLPTIEPDHRAPHISRIAVIAHQGKTLGGGLDELRKLINAEWTDEVLWYEVPTSSKAPAKVRKALKKGADLLFVWGGGGGMVQQCAHGSDRANSDDRRNTGGQTAGRRA